MLIKKMKFYINFLLAGSLILLCSVVFLAQKYTGSPVTKDRLMKVISSKAYSLPEIVTTIEGHGVDFKLTSAVEDEFLAIKTRPQIIEAMKNNYRAPATSATTATSSTTKNNVAANTNRSMANTNVSQSSTSSSTDTKYEELYFQGLQLMSQLPKATSPQQVNQLANQIIEIGYQGIELDKSRPEAYKVVGSGLMLNGQYDMAEKFGQEAINRGSSLGFLMYHLSGTPHPETLYVGKGYITVESNQKYFQFMSNQILEVSPQGFYNLPNGGSAAVLGIATSKDGRNDAWYFAPGLTGSSQEAAMIMRLIKKNASGGR